MNKAFTVKVVTLITALLVSTNANAAGNTASASAAVSATVVAPISITKTQDMAFGQVIADGVSVKASTAPALFTVNASPSSVYSLLINGGSATLNLAGPTGSAALPVTLSGTILVGAASSALAIVNQPNINTGTSSSQAITLNGSVKAPVGQTPGAYAATLNVVVTYQ